MYRCGADPSNMRPLKDPLNKPGAAIALSQGAKNRRLTSFTVESDQLRC